MGRIIKIGHIEAQIDEPGDVLNIYWDECEPYILKNYGKGWRLPTLEELQYIRSLKYDLGVFPNMNTEDDYWTSTEGVPDYIPDRNDFENDLRFYYQVRFDKSNPSRNYDRGFICHVDYYGNILPVRDI
jgi:hypothetical protein